MVHSDFTSIQQNRLLYLDLSTQASHYFRRNRFKINLRAQKINHVRNEVDIIMKQAVIHELQMHTSDGNGRYKSSNRPVKPVTIKRE